MGSCASSDKSSSKKKQISPKIQLLAAQILSKFGIAAQIMKTIENICSSEDALIQISKSIVQILLQSQNTVSIQEKHNIQLIFTPELIEKIKTQTIFFNQTKQIFLKTYQRKQIKKSIESMIYHKIANIKKQIKYDRYGSKNNEGVYIQLTNQYQELSSNAIDEVSKLEELGETVSKIGQRICFRFKQIEQQSEEIEGLLQNCLLPYLKPIQKFVYDLSDSQIDEISMISRKACDFYQNGVYILLVYLVNSARRLESIGQTIENIENRLIKVIERIGYKYPPGQGLDGGQKQLLQPKLSQLEKQQKFQHFRTFQLQYFNKREQLKQIIIEHAKLASKNKPLFQDLLRNTCLKRCVAFKLGLKYNPDNPNPKAITRIQQKMLFKNKQVQRSQKKSIKQTLEGEQEQYKKSLDSELLAITSITFTISDMVRGKCIFVGIEDIISTVYDIKSYIDEQNLRNGGKYHLLEVQSRFTRNPPISDITLKIGLNDEIVAQLQLTLQTNFASYNFAHKIYELNRSKAFSKIKIVHNYYEQYESQFSQLMKQKFQQSSIEKPLQQKQIIRNYFNLNEQKSKSFSMILKQVLQQNIELKQKQTELVCLQQNLQPFLLSIFNLKMGKWDKQIGSNLNLLLNNQNHTISQKSTLLYFFFLNLNCDKQFPRIKIYVKDYILLPSYCQKYFNIKNVYQTAKHNSKAYFIVQKLQKQFSLINDQSYYLKHCYNITYGQSSHSNMQQSLQIINILFKCQKYNIFEEYVNYLIKISKIMLTQSQQNDSFTLLSLKLLIAQKNNITNFHDRSLSLLEDIHKKFKEKHAYDKVILCDLLMAECEIKKDNVQEYKNCIKKIQESIRINGLELKGANVAQAQWRIGVQCWRIANMNQDQNMKILALKTHFSKAITQFSGYKSEELIYTMSLLWQQYQIRNLQYPQLSYNLQIKKIDLKSSDKNFPQIGYRCLIQVKWYNLTTLSLTDLNLNSKSCEILSKGKWKLLKDLYLCRNNIGDEGCKYLKNCDWPNMKNVFVQQNNIGELGCKYLIQCKWNLLQQLQLQKNKIGDEGCKILSNNNWFLLSQLNLNSNSITSIGCEYFLNYFPKLFRLYLQSNNINGDIGNPFSSWSMPSLHYLFLNNNSIGDKGCANLIRAQISSLQRLFLQDNSITINGCSELIKAEWNNIQDLYIGGNSLQIGVCKQLSKANWPKLSRLYINKVSESSEAKRDFLGAFGLPSQIPSNPYGLPMPAFNPYNPYGGAPMMNPYTRAPILTNPHHINEVEEKQALRKLFKQQKLKIYW